MALSLKAGISAGQYTDTGGGKVACKQTSCKLTATPSKLANKGVARVSSACFRILQGGQGRGGTARSFTPVRKAYAGPYNTRHVAVTRSELESEKLPTEEREGVLDLLDSSGSAGGGVTVGDVAARTGLTVSAAKAVLRALAVDTAATLRVSDDGDIVYFFNDNPRAALATKSFALRIRPALLQAQAIAGWVGRVVFGVSLLASIVFVYTLIFAILLVASRFGGGGSDNLEGLLFNPLDIVICFAFHYDTAPRPASPDGRRMNFFEAVFSFVFGDGDQHRDVEKERWANVGRLIRDSNGVVTAEELAPYTDRPERLVREGARYADEGFVLPVLHRFQGAAETTERGELLYRFPALQTSAGAPPPEDIYPPREYLDEPLWRFSDASWVQQAFTVFLASLNLAGVYLLSTLFGWDARAFAMLFVDRSSSPLAVQAARLVLPALQLYAVSFFVIPFVRLIANFVRNSRIAARNSKRRDAWLALEEPSAELREKLESARAAAQCVRVIGESEIAYSTDKGLMSQDLEGKEFDRSIRERQD